MDVTPAIPADRQVIDGYDDAGFRIAQTRYEGAVIVTAKATASWTPKATEGLDDAAAAEIVAALDGAADVVLLGAGARLTPPPKPFVAAVRAAGLRIEPMDTGGACPPCPLSTPAAADE